MRMALPLAVWLGAGGLEAQDALARAERLMERKEYVAAEAVLRQAAAADPSSARVHGNLALALLSQGKVREAVEEGERAAALAAEAPEARYIYGLTLTAVGRPIEAARELETVVTARPDAPAPLEALADAYAAAQDDRAVTTYERLVLLSPRAPAYRVGLAESLWAAGETERGNRVLADALRALPGEGGLHSRYGHALFEQQRFADSARELWRARELGVKDVRTFSALAHALWRSGEAEAAVEAFTVALQGHPGTASLHEDFGRLLLAVGRPEQALERLQEAVRAHPGQAGVHLELGRACETVGKLAEAEEAYRKAISLGPQLATPHYALGRLLVRRGDRERGEQELALYRTLYEQAARRTQEASIRGGEIAHAWAELHQGRAEAALSRFQAVPESAEALVGQASALSRLGRHRDAVRVLERARELEPRAARIQTLLASERALSERRPQ